MNSTALSTNEIKGASAPQHRPHTPGPWRIGDAGRTVFGPKSEHPAPVAIADLPAPSPRVSVAQRKANARLIAAAPELLEELGKVLNIAIGHASDARKIRYDEAEAFPWAQRAAALLARVRGAQ